MRWSRVLALWVGLGAVAAGCYTTKNYGRGECKEYEPVCLGGGDLVCTRDDRGCRMCTCEDRDVPGPALEDDYGEHRR